MFPVQHIFNFGTQALWKHRSSFLFPPLRFCEFWWIMHLDFIQAKSAKPSQHQRVVAQHKAEAAPSSQQLLSCHLISLPHEVPAKVQVFFPVNIAPTCL